MATTIKNALFSSPFREVLKPNLPLLGKFDIKSSPFREVLGQNLPLLGKKSTDSNNLKYCFSNTSRVCVMVGIFLDFLKYCLGCHRLYMDIHQFRVSNLSMVGKSKNLKNKKGYYCNQSPVFLVK